MVKMRLMTQMPSPTCLFLPCARSQKVRLVEGGVETEIGMKVGVRVEGGAEAARGGVEMEMLVRVGVGVGVGLARGRMATGVNVGVRLGLGEGAVMSITNARERGTPTMRMCVEVVDPCLLCCS